MSSNLLPETLRDAVGGDLHPVRPLHPAWQRTLVVALADMGDIPMWLSWGCSFLEIFAGILIIGLALREAIPGGGVPAGAARTAIATGLVLQVLVGIVTWMHSAGMPLGDDWVSKGMGCLKHDMTMILPTFVVTMWLVFRALPMRAPMAGLLGGLGAGITGDAITHLLCPMSDLRHVLTWHTGAIIGFMALGWIVGTLWSSTRWK